MGREEGQAGESGGLGALGRQGAAGGLAGGLAGRLAGASGRGVWQGCGGGGVAGGELRRTRRRLLDEIDGALVVAVLDARPGQLLLGVERLLGLEDEDQEELLQLLVGKVDAELLERVDLEELEAVDVEEADEEAVVGGGALWGEGGGNAAHARGHRAIRKEKVRA